MAAPFLVHMQCPDVSPLHFDLHHGHVYTKDVETNTVEVWDHDVARMRARGCYVLGLVAPEAQPVGATHPGDGPLPTHVALHLHPSLVPDQGAPVASSPDAAAIPAPPAPVIVTPPPFVAPAPDPVPEPTPSTES